MACTKTTYVLKHFFFILEQTDINFAFGINFGQNNTESNDGVVVDEQQQQQGRDSTAVIAVKDDIPQECLIKHPLQNKWTLWYLEVDRTKSWEDMQNKIASFETVEDFWSLYNHIRVASELKVGNDYSLFKNNIRPMWEDKGNKRGGRWLLNLNKSHRRNELDVIWLDIVSGRGAVQCANVLIN